MQQHRQAAGWARRGGAKRTALGAEGVVLERSQRQGQALGREADADAGLLRYKMSWSSPTWAPTSPPAAVAVLARWLRVAAVGAIAWRAAMNCRWMAASLLACTATCQPLA